MSVSDATACPGATSAGGTETRNRTIAEEAIAACGGLPCGGDAGEVRIVQPCKCCGIDFSN